MTLTCVRPCKAAKSYSNSLRRGHNNTKLDAVSQNTNINDNTFLYIIKSLVRCHTMSSRTTPKNTTLTSISPPKWQSSPRKKGQGNCRACRGVPEQGARFEFNAIASRELGVHDQLETLLNEEIRCSQGSSPQGDALAKASSITTDTKPAVVGISVQEWHKEMPYTESAWSQTNEFGLNIAQVRHVVNQVQKLFINDGRPQHQGGNTTLLKMLDGEMQAAMQYYDCAARCGAGQPRSVGQCLRRAQLGGSEEEALGPDWRSLVIIPLFLCVV